MDLNATQWMDATDQAAAISDGECTPLELVDAAIARIERMNPTLNAVIHQRFEAARAEAARPADLPNGPLHGVPFLLKDLIQTVAGEPHSMGWKVLKDIEYRATTTSYVAQKFDDAGLIRVGQTTVPEWGATLSAETAAWGITRNPWDTNRAAGGSSTGSAVAVASGMVPLAHGNDAGGSIRIPAAFCGLVGLKATRGRSSLGPLHGDYLSAQSEEGVLARSVRDAALGLDIITGSMPGDPFPAPAPSRPYSDEIGIDPGNLRIGYLDRTPPDVADFSNDARTALTNALTLLTSLGHRVQDSHPAVLENDGLTDAFLNIVACQEAAGAATMQHQLGRELTADDFEQWTWALIERGKQTPATAYLAYPDWRNSVSRGIAQWWEQGYDVLVMPTVSRCAPLIGELAMGPADTLEDLAHQYFSYVPFTHIFNATGQPALTLPLHVTPQGLPLGVMFVAARGREDVLLQLASQLEYAAPWKNVHPSGLAPTPI